MKLQYLNGTADNNAIYHNGMELIRVMGINGEEYYQSLNGEFFQKVGNFFKKVGSGTVEAVKNMVTITPPTLQTNTQTTTPTTTSNTNTVSLQQQLLQQQQAQRKNTLLTVGICGGVAVLGLIAVIALKK
ncbi:MAG: hypothetical protein LBU90_10250 [Bacteroidales bacterium]|jgi:hypothetical protein|nr:hypothetical protein [Bacteroidales bacterium]